MRKYKTVFIKILSNSTQYTIRSPTYSFDVVNKVFNKEN